MPDLPPHGSIRILRGDVRRLRCDAWCLPADGQGRVDPGFLAWPEGANRELGPPEPFAHWSREAARCRPIRGWPSALPQPWALHVELDPQVPASWLIEGLLGFVDQAGRRARRAGVDRPVLAIPFGVAGVGAAQAARASRVAGALGRALLPELRAAAEAVGVDIVLVAHTDTSFAALQAAREQGKGADAPRPLPAEWEELARAVEQRALVLVLGELPGVPRLAALLTRLAEEQGHPPAIRAALASLGIDESLHLLGRQAGGTSRLVGPLAAALATPHHEALHGLLAGLDPCMVVLESADDRMEQALQAAGRRPVALGEEAAEPTATPVLRMAGSARVPASLALARLDGSWRGERLAALRAAAQVCMPHGAQVLVLGEHEPGRLLRTLAALEPVVAAREGGGCFLSDDDALRGLRGLLPEGTRWLRTAGAVSPTVGRPAALLDALDALGRHAWRRPLLLDPGLKHLREPADEALARGLEDFVQALSPQAAGARAWSGLRRWLEAHGLPAGAGR